MRLLSLQEIAAQVNGLDHPEVADLAAVSTAVGRLQDQLGRSGPHLRCVQAASKYLGNVLMNPPLDKVTGIDCKCRTEPIALARECLGCTPQFYGKWYRIQV